LNFKKGLYNLGETEFKQRWQDMALDSGAGPGAEGLSYDPDTDIEPDRELWLEVWEWHGAVPYQGDLVECCATFITERNAESPEDGVMVRLTTRPLLDCGWRPFVTAQFIPRPGPFGVGIIEREKEIIYQLSQFIGQAQDNARLTSNAMFQVRAGSPAWKALRANGNTIQPGMIFEMLAGEDAGIKPVDLPPFPNNDIMQMVQWLGNCLDRRTTVSDLRQGISEERKTATEANILQQQGMVPLRSKTVLFAKNFLKPAFTMCLAMIEQFSDGDQTVVVRNAAGQDVPLVITKEELQSGRWEVEPSVLRQDQLDIARAQSIERIIPTLANLQPMLAREGSSVSFTELARQYLELVGLENGERVIVKAPPPPVQPPGPVAPQGNVPAEGPGGPPAAPPQSGPPFLGEPPQLVKNGGPMGPSPTNDNALAQFLQLNSFMNQGGTL
ncbi:MAG: hypothetical protein ABWK01_05010, partial [Infirmifilum sp.]